MDELNKKLVSIGVLLIMSSSLYAIDTAQTNTGELTWVAPYFSIHNVFDWINDGNDDFKYLLKLKSLRSILKNNGEEEQYTEAAEKMKHIIGCQRENI